MTTNLEEARRRVVIESPVNGVLVLAALINAEARVPEGMKNCTILFKECAIGHGWLTAKNWVDHGCPTCRAERAEALNDLIANRLKTYGLDAGTLADDARRIVAILSAAKEVKP
jgi:hypothetical protein